MASRVFGGGHFSGEGGVQFFRQCGWGGGGGNFPDTRKYIHESNHYITRRYVIMVDGDKKGLSKSSSPKT